MLEQADLSVEVIGCLVEAIADDEDRIDQKCFEKICNAFVKALLITMKVDVKIRDFLKDAALQVGNIVYIDAINAMMNTYLQAKSDLNEDFFNKFTEELLKKTKNAFPLVCFIPAPSQERTETYFLIAVGCERPVSVFW